MIQDKLALHKNKILSKVLQAARISSLYSNDTIDRSVCLHTRLSSRKH